MVPHPRFISKSGRPTGAAPGVRGPVCTPKHNHEAEKCLQSCPASGNNPVHKGRKPGHRGQEVLLPALGNVALPPTEKNFKKRFLGPRQGRTTTAAREQTLQPKSAKWAPPLDCSDSYIAHKAQGYFLFKDYAVHSGPLWLVPSLNSCGSESGAIIVILTANV